MGPKILPCALCAQPSKYRCPSCPVRYCSVACYKTHKESCISTPAHTGPAPSLEPPAPPADPEPQSPSQSQSQSQPQSRSQPPPSPPHPLRPLTSLKWPPEPDPMVFTDPLRRDDPKPLRPAELERIATSQPLRDLLAEDKLTRILAVLDGMPARARHDALARLLGVDGESLARPAAAATLERGSPPPLGEILARAAAPRREGWAVDGWWLGQDQGQERVWIGDEERQLVRLWAGVVVREIDGEGVGGEGAWGRGELAWEIGE